MTKYFISFLIITFATTTFARVGASSYALDLTLRDTLECSNKISDEQWAEVTDREKIGTRSRDLERALWNLEVGDAKICYPVDDKCKAVVAKVIEKYKTEIKDIVGNSCQNLRFKDDKIKALADSVKDNHRECFPFGGWDRRQVNTYELLKSASCSNGAVAACVSKKLQCSGYIICPPGNPLADNEKFERKTYSADSMLDGDVCDVNKCLADKTVQDFKTSAEKGIVEDALESKGKR